MAACQNRLKGFQSRGVGDTPQRPVPRYIPRYKASQSMQTAHSTQLNNTGHKHTKQQARNAETAPHKTRKAQQTQ